MFKIVNITRKEDYLENDETLVFKTGAEAKELVDYLNKYNYGRDKFAVKLYVVPSDLWKLREQEKFNSGEYVKVVPELEKYCLPDHFVHVALKTPEKISYTSSPDKGARNKQTLASVMGYLEKYAPTLSYEEREEIDGIYSDQFSTYELKWATTSHEIKNVYTQYDEKESGVAQSCMRYEVGEDSEFISEIHPVQVYGDSDLKLAFITNQNGLTAARALVWPEKKIYSRVYGGEVSRNKLHRLLKKEGFKKSSGYYQNDPGASEHSINGALIQAIPYTGKNKVNAHVMPYIDESHRVGMVFIDGKKWMKIGEHGFKCQITNGLTHNDDELMGERCECCEECTDGQLTYVTYTQYDELRYCSVCLEESAFYCHGTNLWFNIDNYESFMVDGMTYEGDYAKEHFYECPECDEFHSTPLLSVNDNGNISKMCQICFDKNYGETYQLDENGVYTLIGETKEPVNDLKTNKKKSFNDFIIPVEIIKSTHEDFVLEAILDSMR